MALLQPVDGPRELHGRRKLEVFNPATLERLGEIEVASEDDVRRAVERARAAQKEWGKLGFAERGRHLLKAREVLIDRLDEVVDTICADTGKPRIEALSAEVLASCDALTWYAKRSKRLLADERRPLHLARNKRLIVSYRPKGVVGVITPWNFPFVLSINPVVQALMAGNSVVLKPSEVTPFVGRMLGEIFTQAGLPDGVFQVICGDGSTGAALVEAGCNKISFTGSVRTGRAIAESCGRQLIDCTLELGGKDPMIVCEDADIERAAHGAVWGAFSNSGQVCMSTERVYVVAPVAEAFVNRVVQLTRELRQGPESQGEIDVGALSFTPQLEIIERHVAEAVGKGAKVLTGGRRNPEYEGFFFEPTVLTDVTHEMEIMREETFGPCLPIQVVESEEKAIELANESHYGLQASIWTRDLYKARRIAGQIEAGGVTVDDTMVTYGITESPFGGIKDSGLGRVNGEMGLKSYCDVQSVVLPRFRAGGSGMGYPYTTKALRGMRRLIHLLYRSPLGKILGN